jgi:hypothetical protein
MFLAWPRRRALRRYHGKAAQDNGIRSPPDTIASHALAAARFPPYAK